MDHESEREIVEYRIEKQIGQGLPGNDAGRIDAVGICQGRVRIRFRQRSLNERLRRGGAEPEASGAL
jgi:hypothetical protein